MGDQRWVGNILASVPEIRTSQVSTHHGYHVRHGHHRPLWISATISSCPSWLGEGGKSFRGALKTVSQCFSCHIDGHHQPPACPGRVLVFPSKPRQRERNGRGEGKQTGQDTQTTDTPPSYALSDLPNILAAPRRPARSPPLRAVPEPRRAPLVGRQRTQGQAKLEVGPFLRALCHVAVPI